MKTEDINIQDTILGRGYRSFFGHCHGLYKFVNPANYNELKNARVNLDRIKDGAKFLPLILELSKLHSKFEALNYPAPDDLGPEYKQVFY